MNMVNQYLIRKKCGIRLVIVGLLLVNVYTINAQILDERNIESADTQVLKNELDVFATIQYGISLSVAECEVLDTCSASVNRGEVEQMMTTIDSRVNTLSLRYTETGDTGLESILVGYADMRDSYNEILEKMADMPQFEQQQEITTDLERDDFFTSGASRSNSVSNDLMQLFRDSDEELVDDFSDESTIPENN